MDGCDIPMRAGSLLEDSVVAAGEFIHLGLEGLEHVLEVVRLLGVGLCEVDGISCRKVVNSWCIVARDCWMSSTSLDVREVVLQRFCSSSHSWAISMEWL